MWDRLFIDVHLAAMTRENGAGGGAPYGAIRGGALAVKDGRIAFVGAESDLAAAPRTLARSVETLGGRWMTPGLVDCHTHLVFAGDRAGEFEQRLMGASYEEIAKAGGGILSTVRATRNASLDSLTETAAARLAAMARMGVTTVEIKSGYGLTVEDELKMLEAATRAGAQAGVRVRRTLLAMHALPPEFKADRNGYVDLVCNEILPEAKRRGLVDAVDAFCEGIGFTRDETERLFGASKALGLPVKLHAEQLSDFGGAGLVAQCGGLSADHLEYANDDDIAAMAQAGTVAVLLPGAFYFLKETKKPPVDKLRRVGVAMALASDFNPGSSPVMAPRLVMNMGATLFALTPEEALAGYTRNAAIALGLGAEAGTLETGKTADLAVWDIGAPAELTYWIGGPDPVRVIVGGEDYPREKT